LAAQCDVIIENFSAGVLKRWGLDRAGMAAANPALTVISMGGMGQSGPWKDFVTFAPTIHAVTGLTHLTNFPGRTGDIGYGFSLTDHLSGLVGAVAALEALEYRRRTGQGLEIDLSQYEMGLGLMAPALIDCLANGVNPAPAGNRHPYNAWAPHGIYRCTGDDAWIAIAAREDREWVALCGVMGRPDLAGDPRFASHAARVANQDALDALIEDWTRTRDRYDAMAACQAAGVMAGAVQNAEDLTRRVPQNVHRRFFGLLPSSAWGDYPAEAFPATFNGRRPAVGEGVHDAGADTFDVLTGILGLSDDEVAELAESGALS
jgi:crotonobetainyl-CoA:carnitine CoA-transferase CaiB-like acyl-CoA transferase